MIIKEILPDTCHDTVISRYINVDTNDIVSGDVVVIDTSDLSKRGAKCITTADSSLAKGIAINDIKIREMGDVVISGITKANVGAGAAAIAIGEKLGTSAVRGRLGVVTSNPVAIALETVAANSVAKIFVDVRRM